MRDDRQRPVGGATPVSVLVTARDEEELLPGALASVRGWAAEVVVVVDPRSTDATADIASLTGAMVLVNEYTSSAAQCNWGLARCAHRWVFVLDADERLTPALRGSISAALAVPRAQAYAVRRRNLAFGQPLRFGDWGRDWIVRLLDREHARFREQAVHGSVEAQHVGRLDGVLEHHTLRSLAQYVPKLHDYAVRGATDLARAGTRGSVAKALLHANWRALRGLVLRLGVLDGPAGWVVAVLLSYGTFLKWVALWQLGASGAPRPANLGPSGTARPAPATRQREPR